MFRQIQKNTARVLQALLLFGVVLSLLMGFSPNSAYAKSALGGPANVACSHVRFIGIRGSGDQPQGKQDKNDPNHNMGKVVYKTYTRFLAKMKDKGISVSGEGLNYKAVPVWDPFMQASVDGGVHTLTDILKANKDCVVLAGYSQGAWVIHDTLDDRFYDLPLSARLRVKAVLAFGDPHFDPKDRGALRYGTAPKMGYTASEQRKAEEWADASSRGYLGAHDFPSWLFAVRSYCKRYDPICSAFAETTIMGALTGGLDKCVPAAINVAKKWCAHLDYYDDNAIWDQAASWLAGLFTKPTNPIIPTSPRLVTCSDHMKAPWVALYGGINYEGQSLCFEGRGRINLRDYSYDMPAGSVNIAANVVFYDGAGNQISYGYGYETGDLGEWKWRFVSFVINS